jgi:hypothetical protein
MGLILVFFHKFIQLNIFFLKNHPKLFESFPLNMSFATIVYIIIMVSMEITFLFNPFKVHKSNFLDFILSYYYINNKSPITSRKKGIICAYKLVSYNDHFLELNFHHLDTHTKKALHVLQRFFLWK